MIDHISIAVTDLERAARFYEALLGTLGFERLARRRARLGFGKCYPEFWINERPSPGRGSVPDGAHVALRAASVAQVRAFHAAALAAGGSCDGPPGRREATHPGYYAAFIRDPDGNRIEAVTFLADAEGLQKGEPAG
ncbi:MAG: VOC family protein [Methyloligellaceae bacterium]